MSYCDEAAVESRMAKFPITATSKPNQTQVLSQIEDIGGEIDSALAARGVTVPVEGPPRFLRKLKALNAYGAAAGVLKSMFPDTVGADETPAYAFWERRYRDGMAELKDGSGIPDTVIGTTSGYVAPSTYFTNNPDTEVEDGDISGSFFTRAKVF